MNCFNQSLSGRCRRGVVPPGWPSLEPPYRWPALQAGCQPRVSWSMLVKRTLIWVWQGNQQPNSTVKLNSVVEHHSASFMLRLQKGKVPQHQFVTRAAAVSAGSPQNAEREIERESLHQCGQISVLSSVTSPVASNNRKKGLLQWCEWAEWVKETVTNERGESGVGLFQGLWGTKNRVS